jgi:pimeloyl-ACP methyl ester carboxylesterase
MRTLLTLIFWFIVTAAFAQSVQPDYAREKRWADEITPAILVGDPVYLALKSGHKFLAIHAPTAKPRAGLIVVHGLGMHPDWSLINPLRSQLAEQGYTTLSVQMPVLAADAKGEIYPPIYPEAIERLQAAVAFLREKGHHKIAMIGHSMGARMVNEFINHGGAGAIDAWVSIGITYGLYTKPETFKAPVLDIYGEKDFPAVLQHAATRAQAIQRVRGSVQMEIAGADHFFTGKEAELVKQTRQFLDQRLR